MSGGLWNPRRAEGEVPDAKTGLHRAEQCTKMVLHAEGPHQSGAEARPGSRENNLVSVT
jgi:hypothetical protein